MKRWIRLTLIGMTVGGGFSGISSTLQSRLNSPQPSAPNIVLIVIFMGLYAFVTASGLLFAHDPTRTGPLFAALAIQVPSISSSGVVYSFSAGLQAFISFGRLEKENAIGVHADFRLGSSWRFALQHDNPVRVGVNLVALAILILLWRTLQHSSRATLQRVERIVNS